MNDLLLCKPGEIFLKGLNKHYFEERLVANVKRRLKPIGHFRVTYLQSALYIEAADDAADLDAAYDAVRKVFGIATITRAAAGLTARRRKNHTCGTGWPRPGA